MPDKKGRQTQQEAAFVEAYARSGDKHYAAQVAGYANVTVAASKLLSRAPILDAVATQVQSLRESNVLAALGLINKVLNGESYPIAVRVQAARATLADYSKSAETSAAHKEPHEMTGAEIAGEIQRLQAEAAERARPVLELAAEEEAATSPTSLCE